MKDMSIWSNFFVAALGVYRPLKTGQFAKGSLVFFIFALNRILSF